MFGIAVSADDDPSLRITACHALFACKLHPIPCHLNAFTKMFLGISWVEDPLVQTQLFDLLRRTERENGWPWGYVQQQVVQAWKPL